MSPANSIPGAAPPMAASASSPSETWISVARLLRPQGRRGELLAEPLTDLFEIFSPGRGFRLAAGAEDLSSDASVTLHDAWRPTGRNAGRLVLKLAGVDSIDAAEALEGRELLLRQADLPALDEDTFLVRDLIDCALLDGDRHLGTITDLQFPVGPDGRTRLQDAVDLLVLKPVNDGPEAEPVLIPFVKAWLTSVDLPGKRITMHLPPGLLDEPEATET